MMEPTSEFEKTLELFMDSHFCVSKKVILEDTLFPLSLRLLSDDVPDLTMSEYTEEDLMYHCSKATLGWFIKQFQTLIPGCMKIENGIVKIDKSKGNYYKKKLLDESLSNRRLDTKVKDKIVGLYNYLESSKDMLSSKILRNVLFKSGQFKDNIYAMHVEFEVLLFLAPHWISCFRSNDQTVYRFNEMKLQALKMDYNSKRVELISDGKGRPADILLGSKTLYELVKLRQFFVRKEQESNCSLYEDQLFPLIAAPCCSTDILTLEKVTTLTCSHSFHTACRRERLKQQMILDSNNKELQELQVRKKTISIRELELERAVYNAKTEMQNFQLRDLEKKLNSSKAEVRRLSDKIKVLEEPVLPKCPVCMKTVSFPFA